jgi:hypothetical protein
LARDAQARHEAYRGLFEIPLSSSEIEAIRAATQRGRTLGAAFKPRSAGRPKKNGV